jgi:hypothetical protein
MLRCYDYEKKPVLYKEEWKDTCKRLGYDYGEQLSFTFEECAE